MKVLIFSLFIALISGSISHAADIHALCFTAVGGTTSFIIKTENESVNFEVLNHNGGGYAPFWSSLVVPNDIELLSKKAEIIKQLDMGFKTKWKPDHCNWAGDNKFSCIGSDEKINVNGLLIEPWAVYSSVVKDSSFAGDYDYIDMTVSFQVNNENFNYTMRYQSDECILSEKPIDKTKMKHKK